MVGCKALDKGWRHHPLQMPLGDLHHPEALQFGQGRGVQDLQKWGPSSEYTSWFLFLKKNRRLKVDLRLSLVVLFNKFISKGKEEKLFRKRRNTCSRPLYPRGRQGCHSVPCRLARTVHSLATGRGVCLERILCPVRLRSPPHRSEIHKELG